jgi:prepilin-type N-terminal cleavage/methylation domain-containing protein
MFLFLNKKSTFKKGFTLIEIIVSLAIFSIVSVIAVGALLKIIDANKKSQSLKTAINNVSFVLESMSRELRVGTNYYCTKTNFTLSSGASLPSRLGCSADVQDWIIAFYSSNTASNGAGGNCHLVYAYRFANGTIEKAEQTTCSDSLSNSSFHPVISKDVKFSKASLAVNVSPVGSFIEKQSYALIHLVGYVGGKENVQTHFDVQTSISQRLTD